MNHHSPFALRLGATLSVVWASALGCSGDEDTPASSGGMGGTGTGMSGAGTVAQGGTSNAGSGTGGSTVAQGGTSGGGAGGAAGAGDPSTPLSDNQCSGIRSNQACAFVGTCAARPCGLADLGTRDCVCDGSWTCTSCAYPTGPTAPSVLAPPGTGDGGAIPTCAAGVADDIACSPMGERCIQGTAPAGDDPEGCACWLTDDDGANIWDCDNQPSTWD